MEKILKPKIDNAISSADMRIFTFKEKLESLVQPDEKRRQFASALSTLSLFIVFTATYNLYMILIYGLRKDIIIRKIYGYEQKQVLYLLCQKLIPSVILGVSAGALVFWLIIRKIFFAEQFISFGTYLSVVVSVGFLFFLVAIFLIYVIMIKIINYSSLTEILNDSSLTT